ncbi:MAG: hypothetical protein HOP35_02025 [Nitrospira sp.]|nr:hypothetical protein [Nitrospira sp.]
MPGMLLTLRCLSPIPRPSTSITTLFLVSLVLGGLVAIIKAAPAAADPAPNPMLTQTARSAKTASPHIGSAMAALATLQDADVLPPEGTPEANHIIRFVIQFQSVFTKSDDPAVQEFARQALAHKYGDQAADIVKGLRTTGWTADVLERLSDEEARHSSENLHTLAQGFAPFNLSVEEFHRFMQLVRDARQAFRTRGLEFQHIFSSRRKEMPGAESS